MNGLGAVAIATMVVLAIAELHLEVVSGAAAWLAAWWFLREPTPR